MSSFTEPECNFYGVRLPAGKPTTVTADFDEDSLETIHLTQVALGEKPKAGAHTIFIEKDGEKYAIGTLDSSKCAQFSMDITLATDTITLSHTGGSDVYVTGYKTVAIHMSDDEEDYDGGGRYLGSSDDEDGSESESEEDESSDDEVPPRGVPIANGKVPTVRRLIDDEAESSEEEEEGSEDDEEEGKALAMGLGRGTDDSEEEESEEEEDSEEELVPAKPVQMTGEKKRPAPAAPPSKTPQPAAKKAKAEPAAAPASAPDKGSASVAAGTASYVTGLKAFLQQNGPTKIAVLGSKVKRPEKVPKLKSVLEQNAKLFKFDVALDTVSLA